MRRQRLAWAEKGWSTRTRRRPSFSSRDHGNGKRRLGERAGEGREKERERVSGSSERQRRSSTGREGELASSACAWRPPGSKQTARSATELQIQKF